MGSWSWNIKSGEIIWSDEMYTIFGIDKKSISGRLGDAISRVVHPDDLHIFQSANITPISQKIPFEYRIIYNDNSVRHIWSKSGSVILDDLQNPVFLTGIVQDITERKIIEDKLLKSEGRIREILENSIDVPYKRNLLTNSYDYISSRFEDISGYSLSDINSLHDETLIDFIHPDDLPEIERVFEESKIWNIGKEYNVEYRFKHREGYYRWFHDKFVVIRDECSQNVALIGSISDITEKKHLISDLKNAIEMKDNFLTIITHELKTPIAIINSSIEAMQFLCKNELSDESKGYLEKIRHSSNRQLKLVNNLLDITRANAGYLKTKNKNLDIVMLTQSAIELVKSIAVQKSIMISFSSTLSKKVIGIDEEKYERILFNILSNAIKFTPNGKSITVKISQKIVKGSINEMGMDLEGNLAEAKTIIGYAKNPNEIYFFEGSIREIGRAHV